MNDTVLKQSAMRCLIDNFGHVEAERFIALMIKEPFDYTKWQQNLYDGLTVKELSAKAAAYKQKKTEQNRI